MNEHAIQIKVALLLLGFIVFCSQDQLGYHNSFGCSFNPLVGKCIVKLVCIFYSQPNIEGIMSFATKKSMIRCPKQLQNWL